MDWVDDDGTAREGRPLGDRLEQWVSRGRELVDGVAGTRPGSRPDPRGSGRGGLRRGDGLGRWVEGKLDWLLDDREDWREPWETDRAAAPSTSGDPAPRRSRPPLEAISRRGAAASAPFRQPPARPSASRPAPPPPAREPPARERPAREPVAEPGDDAAHEPLDAFSRQDWPEEEVFTVPRWRRQEPPPSPPADPLAAAPPPAPTGRPLPRSTRRR
ncbi:MAG: hypothetical protein VKO26_07620 [Cyanobacteriota bacterium]|nr:hypothetical protein [Cyanobacteriota bacterium]